jgi:hypothetical protein
LVSHGYAVDITSAVTELSLHALNTLRPKLIFT